MSQRGILRSTKRKMTGSLPKSQRNCILFLICVGLSFMAVNASADYLFADDPIYVLGGVYMVKKMDTINLSMEVAKKFPKLDSDISYAMDTLCIRGVVLKREISFSQSILGEWIGFEGDLHENPRDVLIVDVFVEGQKDSIKIVFCGDDVLLHKS